MESLSSRMSSDLTPLGIFSDTLQIWHSWRSNKWCISNVLQLKSPQPFYCVLYCKMYTRGLTDEWNRNKHMDTINEKMINTFLPFCIAVEYLNEFCLTWPSQSKAQLPSQNHAAFIYWKIFLIWKVYKTPWSTQIWKTGHSLPWQNRHVILYLPNLESLPWHLGAISVLEAQISTHSDTADWFVCLFAFKYPDSS